MEFRGKVTTAQHSDGFGCGCAQNLVIALTDTRASRAKVATSISCRLMERTSESISASLRFCMPSTKFGSLRSMVNYGAGRLSTMHQKVAHPKFNHGDSKFQVSIADGELPPPLPISGYWSRKRRKIHRCGRFTDGDS